MDSIDKINMETLQFGVKFMNRIVKDMAQFAEVGDMAGVVACCAVIKERIDKVGNLGSSIDPVSVLMLRGEEKISDKIPCCNDEDLVLEAKRLMERLANVRD